MLGFLAAARIGAVVVPLNTFYKPREPFDAELPFTDSGKIDKRRLGRLLAERVATGA